jgi:large conductance mechanosensitive channel
VLTLSSMFIDSLVNFFGIGLCLYVLGSAYGWMSKDNVIKSKVKCKYCKKYISEKVGLPFLALLTPVLMRILQAKRCAFCTSWQQDGMEEAMHS